MKFYTNNPSIIELDVDENDTIEICKLRIIEYKQLKIGIENINIYLIDRRNYCQRKLFDDWKTIKDCDIDFYEVFILEFVNKKG